MILPDWMPVDAWNGWLEMRRLKKWPLTARAEKQAIEKLGAYREQGYDIEWILDEANNQCWRGLFVNERTPKRTLKRTQCPDEPLSPTLQAVRDRVFARERKIRSIA